MSVATTKKTADKAETGVSTTVPEQIRFLTEIELWENQSYDLRAEEEQEFKDALRVC